MNLHQYLLKIDSDTTTAINLTKFIAVLPEGYKLTWQNIFQRTKARGKDQYNLTVIDAIAFKQLLEISSPSKDRPDASGKGNSHGHKTSMSYLLVYPNAFNVNSANKNSANKIDTGQNQNQKQINQAPEVVVCTSSALTINFQPRKTLIIIENQENFFRYQEFLPYLFTNNTDNENYVDVAFGSGNSVTNSLNSLYFNQYHDVLCCFDYDLGGLTMFSSLSKITNAKVSFILPSKSQLQDETFLLAHFKKVLKPKEVENWREAIKLANTLGFTDLAQAFNITKKFMEQEVYLAGSFLEN